ncbi:MAG: adenylyltransferase/cytidyltransferase family protein [Candidatus Woesearchaeota archaeon]
MKIICVSGYFTILHVGHIRMFKEAKALGDKLVVILNNDKQLIAKKGRLIMSAEHRKEILEAIKYIDEVVISIDEDRSVCKTLEMIKPDVFANGGDRNFDNIPEVKTCQENNIEMVWNIGAGGKVDSSSRLIEESEKN